jgi:hypothetical protein
VSVDDEGWVDDKVWAWMTRVREHGRQGHVGMDDKGGGEGGGDLRRGHGVPVVAMCRECKGECEKETHLQSIYTET